MSSGDFLSRWSRRKQEARRAERAPEVPSEEAAPPETPAVEGAPGAEAELTADEIAQLPKIEELTVETDITAFLGRGVPESLRNAALRKMWTLDPAIRDFEGHARDYAYDWSVPGGVPGAGPLGPGDDPAALVRRVFGESEPAPAADQSGVEPSRIREPAAGAEGEEPVVAAAQQETVGEEPGTAPAAPESMAESPPGRAETPTSFAAPQSEPAAKPPPDVPSRRHGGAKPT